MIVRSRNENCCVEIFTVYSFHASSVFHKYSSRSWFFPREPHDFPLPALYILELYQNEDALTYKLRYARRCCSSRRLPHVYLTETILLELTSLSYLFSKQPVEREADINRNQASSSHPLLLFQFPISVERKWSRLMHSLMPLGRGSI